MNKIIESDAFDIILTEHKDYKGDSIYRLCYGLQVTNHNDIVEAIKEFNYCLQHTLRCEGLI